MNTERDVRKVLQEENLLRKDANIKSMKHALHRIGRMDLATKLEKCPVIG